MLHVQHKGSCMEEWKQITGYPDYSISNYGNVKSNRYNRLLKPSSNNQSYLYVNLIKDRRKKTTAVHKLVIDHFGTDCPSAGFVVDHIDGNKQNNQIKNLQWVSISENTQRSYGNNSNKRDQAKNLRLQGMTIKQIAERINMSCGFVQQAIHS